MPISIPISMRFPCRAAGGHPVRWALLVFVLSAVWVGSPAAASADAHASGRVAFIGVPGLHWDDVDPQATPNLWALAGRSALGSMSVKTVGTTTCPFDGWLTVSAGRRAASGGGCGLPPDPMREGAGASVPGFTELTQSDEEVLVGTLGTAVHAAGQCTTAVGRGAALALADRTGKVDVYAASPAELTDWAKCRVLAVDVDDLITPYLVDGRLSKDAEVLSPERRRAAVAAADAKVGGALARLPADAEVLLAGIGDHGGVPHLRVAMWLGQSGYLGTSSTHRSDIVILPDVAPTILTLAGVAVPETVVGVPWAATEQPAFHEAGLQGAVEHLRLADLTGTTVRGLTGLFFTGYAILQVAFYVVTFLLLAKRRRAVWAATAGLALASIPVSTYLINLLPWASARVPGAALVGGVIAIDAVILLLAVGGPWRRYPLGPLAVVGGVTGATVLADLLTGTTPRFNSLMGYTAVVGGRYYGLANIPFALLATSVLMVAAMAADHLVRAGHRRVAVGLVSALGVFAMLLGGWPGIGSDFGGVIAFVPGIAVTAL